MDLFKAIENRFSCRTYTNKKIKDNDLYKILHCGTQAPNAGNLQCWRFIVINEEGKKEELVKAALNQRWMMQAPIFIIICGDLTNEKRFYNERGEDCYKRMNRFCVNFT